MSGIYLHIPYCNTKCIYCDFYSITKHSTKNELIACLVKEIEGKACELKDITFDTIFFGGGTPSLLQSSDFYKLFNALYSNLNISANSEITIEANPGTMDRKKLLSFKELPINRISFGVQSFNDSDLKFLTRIHSGKQAIESIKSAQDAGFENINLDLIYALPGQTLKKWEKNLEKAIKLNTQHVSAYSLIFEEGTPLIKLYNQGKIQPANEDKERKLYDFTMAFFEEYGFNHYEISNYAKPGYECRHNLKYWTHKEYISFGPSAASYIKDYRWVNVRDVNEYIKRIKMGAMAYDFIEYIDYNKSIDEYIMLGLRSIGINLNILKEKYKIDFLSKYKNTAELLIKNNLADIKADTFYLTSKGYAVCDEILATYF